VELRTEQNWSLRGAFIPFPWARKRRTANDRRGSVTSETYRG
jgi:hypothetical protein